MVSLELGPEIGAGASVADETADLGLMTRFGAGVSALSPFETARERRRRSRTDTRGARLGELLLGEGVLTPEELDDALAAQRRTKPKKPLGEILLTSGLVSPPLLVRLLAQQCQLDLEEERGFGTGLRRAIERRHAGRGQPAPAAAEVPVTESAGPRLLGELLVEKHLLTNAQLRRALEEQATSGRLLGEIVVDHGFVSMVALVNALTEQLQAGERQPAA